MDRNLRTKIVLIIRSSLLRDASWLAIGSALGGVLGFAGTVLIVRHYSKPQMGDLFLAMGIVEGLLFFGLPGISTVLISCAARGEGGTFRKAVKWELAGGAFGGIFLFLLAGRIQPTQNIPLWAYGIVALLYPFYVCDCGWQALTGQRKFRFASYLKIATRAVSFLAVVAIVAKDLPISTYFIWNVSLIAVLNMCLVRYVWNDVGDPAIIDSSSFRYGLHLTASSILLQPLGQLEKLLVGFFIGPSRLAEFGLGQMIYGYLKVIGNYSQSLYYPRLSSMTDDLASHYLLKHALIWTIGGLVGAAVLSALLPIVYPLLFGDEYKLSSIFASCYAFIFALGLPNFFLTIYFRHMRATAETYQYTLMKPFAQVLCLVTGFKLFGMVGLPLGLAVSVSVQVLNGAILAARYRGMKARKL